MSTLNETEKKPRGRPKLGNVLFAKRVTPDLYDQLMEFVSDPVRVSDVIKKSVHGPTPVTMAQSPIHNGVARKPQEDEHAASILVSCWRNMNASGAAVSPEDMVNSLKGVSLGNVKALLDDVEAKDKEIEVLKGRIDRLARMTEDERCARWIQKYDEVAAKLKKLESDGSI